MSRSGLPKCLMLLFFVLLFIDTAAAIPPGVEIVANNPYSIVSGEIRQVIVNVRNYNQYPEAVSLHLSSNSELSNWIWFGSHKYDLSRHDISFVMQPYDTKLVAVSILGGNLGSYNTDGIEANGLNINASSASGWSIANISVNVSPPPQGFLKRQAPDLGIAYVLFIGLLGALISQSPGKKISGLDGV